MFEVDDDELASLLAEDPDWTLFPPAADRTAWDGLLSVPWRAAQADRYVEAAGTLAAEPPPALLATDYLEHARTGDRFGYESGYFDRRTRLAVLTLAEAGEHQGRFLDPIIDLVWLLCDEATWCVPEHLGHYGRPRDREPLPRAGEPIIDLFATQTGFLLAVVTQVLRRELDEVSPRIVERVHEQVATRVVDPFVDHDSWWWLHKDFNWNPWCVSNVLGATLCTPTGPRTAAEVVRRGTTSLRSYLDGQAPDGSIEEGPGYWNVSIGSAGIALELLHARTSGVLDGFADPTLRAAAGYLPRVRLDGGQFSTFGDARFDTGVPAGEAHRLGLRTGNDELQRIALLSLKDWQEDGPPRLELDRGKRNAACLSFFFDWFWIPDDTTTAPVPRPMFDGFSDLGVWLLRSSPTEGTGLTVACKGGHNAEMHGHHDVGEVMALFDGEPMLIDVGTGYYTSDDFGPGGGEKWYRRGSGHNLPLINGHEQQPGADSQGLVIEAGPTDSGSRVRLEVTSVYPDEARVKHAERDIVLDARDASVAITDTIECSRRGVDVLTSFMTTTLVTLVGTDTAYLGPRRLVVEADSDVAPAITVEAVATAGDPFMAPAFADRLQRVTVRTAGTGRRLRITFTLSGSGSGDDRP